MKIVSIAWKLIMIEELCKDQSCLFWRGDYGNKGQNPIKSVLGSNSGKDSFFSLEAKHDRRMVPRTRLLVLAGRLQEQRNEA
jgi:hypothetical protein